MRVIEVKNAYKEMKTKAETVSVLENFEMNVEHGKM
jgi:predicted ABC-type transport system involved in lysophospholipase L1 biosynthesis ATPase subunit